MTVELLKAAKSYLAHDLSVIPIFPAGHPREKQSPIKWGKYQKERASLEQVNKWWGNGSKWRLGLLGGPISHDLAVFDIDNLALAKDVRKARDFLADKYVVSTPSGGLHLYFRQRERTGNKVRYEGIGDIRADGGYVVAPPSEGYAFVGSNRRWPVVDNLLEWLIEDFAPQFGLDIKAEDSEDDDDVIDLRTVSRFSLPQSIPEGQRNDMLFRFASSLRGRGDSTELILDALIVENRDRCHPPLDREEIEKIAASVGGYEPNPEIFSFTDTGNSERLMKRSGRDIRYVDDRHQWLVWDGRRWARDATREIHKLAIETIRSIPDEAQGVEKAELKAAILRHAASSLTALKRNSMVSVTRDESAVPDALFDRDPYQLNVLNGTIDLRTGKLTGHRRADHITRLIGVDYRPKAKAPKFMSFFKRILPDAALRRYLWKVLGLALTGDTEQALFVLYGTGANGKSTLIEAIMGLLGDYSRATTSSLLVVKNNEEHPQGIADLEGRRLVVSSEPDLNKSLSESVVKQLTGGDTIVARRLYQGNFEFKPMFTLFLVTNHKLRIRETNTAIWRRIKLIPFEVTIPEAERDMELPKILRREYEGILAWLVKGCLLWQKEGLKDEPEVVRAEVTKYRTESDVIGRFIEETCEESRNSVVRTSALYNAYRSWAQSTGEFNLSQNLFGRRLDEMGFPAIRDRKGARARGGIALKVVRAS